MRAEIFAVPRTDPSCVSVLHEVRDPGNAGTVLRSADAAGASAVVFTSSSVDVYNPKTVRASAGSLFHLPVIRGVPTPEVIESLRGSGFRTFAMDADGSENLYGLDLGGRVAFVFGNEAHGLPQEIVRLADATVRGRGMGWPDTIGAAPSAWAPTMRGRRVDRPAAWYSRKPFQYAVMLPALPTGSSR